MNSNVLLRYRECSCLQHLLFIRECQAAAGAMATDAMVGLGGYMIFLFGIQDVSIETVRRRF